MSNTRAKALLGDRLQADADVALFAMLRRDRARIALLLALHDGRRALAAGERPHDLPTDTANSPVQKLSRLLRQRSGRRAGQA